MKALHLATALLIAATAASQDRNWPTYGGDLASTRYSPLDQIDASNFGEHEIAWLFRTDNLGHSIGNAGEIVWQVAHGETPDNVKNHPALEGIDLPRTGNIGRIGTLVTKTLVISGDGTLLTTASGEEGAMLRAYDKATGEEVGEVYTPGPGTGSDDVLGKRDAIHRARYRRPWHRRSRRVQAAFGPRADESLISRGRRGKLPR